MDVKRIGVIGAGQMGGGIAQVAALCGLDVTMMDVKQEFVDKGKATIAGSLARMVRKGTISESESEATLGRIHGETTLEPFGEVDFVVEAAPENLNLKTDLFVQLDRICPPHAVLSSNTSSISITKLAAATHRPDRFIGMHFMNPVPVMKLVEVIRGLATSEETHGMTVNLAKKMGKIPLEANDFPGFIANRILMPMINEAVFCLYEGVGTPEAIDGVMKLGMNHPMGPLALADLIGLDTCLAILNVLHEGLGDPKYRPCPLLRKYVDAGWLGKKIGRGFYEYSS